MTRTATQNVPPKYIVTGAHGFLGVALTDGLRTLGETLAVDQAWGHAPAVPEPRVEIDLTQALPDAPELERATVIHAAGLVNVEERRMAWDSNVNATFNVLDWAVRHEAAHVVLFSAGEVYPPLHGHRHRETDPVEPVNVFGHSKQLCERLGAAFNRLYDLPVTALRLFHPFGPAQHQGTLVELSRAVRDGRPVAVGTGGTPGRTPVHIDDVVDAVCRVASAGEAYRVFNVCGDEAVTTTELLRLFERRHGREARIEHRDEDLGDLMGDNTLLRGTLGWQPRHTLDILAEIDLD